MLLTALATVCQARAAQPTLVVPPQTADLPLAVKAPAGTEFTADRNWQLVEVGAGGKPLPVDVVPAAVEDGQLSPAERTLLTIIPARPHTGETRRFRLTARSDAPARPAPAFRWSDVTDKALGLWEGQRPVMTYVHGVQTPADVPANRHRSTYVHPIYGLDGEVLTDDFPKDHYHHRGLFWAWPHIRIGDQEYDLWDLRRIEQRFVRWLDRQAGSTSASLGVENGWYVGDRKVMTERVWFHVYAAGADSQAIDVQLTWIPGERPITLEGAPDKSYGGLTLRFAPRTNTIITTPLGNKPEDLAVTRLPWADLTAQFRGAPGPSGAAVFISPDHPDYPPTWLTRHYGVLCVGWPGVSPVTFAPGKPVRCKYRVWIHRGEATAAKLKAVYNAYELVSKVTWETKTD